MASKKSNTNVEKSIYFTFLLYPDSLPSDWKILLEATGRPIAISPLHNKDLVSKKVLEQEIRKGELYLDDNRYILSQEQKDKTLKAIEDLKTKPRYKKPHYHIIYVAKNNVTAQAVRNKFKKLLGDQAINKVQIIATSVRNTYDYLTHESVDAIAKKKHVYSKDDIVTLNNFDVDRYDELDSADKKEVFSVILDIIKTQSIPNVIELEFFIDEYGSEYGITTNVLRTVIDGKAGYLRLYFDGVYQRSKRENADLKKENDEYFKLTQRQMQEIVVLKRKLKDKEK